MPWIPSWLTGDSDQASAPPTKPPQSSADPDHDEVPAGYDEVQRRWLDEVLPDFPEAADDPILGPRFGGTERLLVRVMRAEISEGSPDVARTTLERLRSICEFRRAYKCADFHRPGMARRLFMHKTNPGAAMYFGDCGLRDRAGLPVLVGRVALMSDDRAPGFKPADKLIPATHLRAGMFVVERAFHSARGASYILDLGSFPAAEMAAHDMVRYWDADGTLDRSDVISKRVAPDVAVRPHLPEHEALPDGLPVLKEALRMATTYYPESLRKVYFYRPSLLFRAIFKIFSLWVPPATREKFVLVQEGQEDQHFLAPGMMDRELVPAELGGNGPSLQGDRFLMRAVELYDQTAVLPAISALE